MDYEPRFIDELVASSPNLTEIRNSIAECIPCADQDRPLLNAMAFSDLLMVYAGWRDRFISRRKRKVGVWDGFWTAQVNDNAAAINEIVSIFEEGGDLTPYLSPRVHGDGFAPRATNRRGLIVGGKDRALNAYGVHHLHMTSANAKGKRSGDSKALLFARVMRQDVHLIHLGNHSSFDDGSLRQAVADADVAAGIYIRGIEGVSREVSAAEGEALLRQGVNSAIASGGKWTFAEGLSTAMTSIMHRRDVDWMVITIEEIEPLTRTPDGRAQLCQRFGVEYDETLRFGWAIQNIDLILVDARCHRAVAEVPWRR